MAHRLQLFIDSFRWNVKSENFDGFNHLNLYGFSSVHPKITDKSLFDSINQKLFHKLVRMISDVFGFAYFTSKFAKWNTCRKVFSIRNAIQFASNCVSGWWFKTLIHRYGINCIPTHVRLVWHNNRIAMMKWCFHFIIQILLTLLIKL